MLPRRVNYFLLFGLAALSFGPKLSAGQRDNARLISATCALPGPIPNTITTLSNQTLASGSYITWECSDGYMMDGLTNTAVWVCLEDGSWLGHTPICKDVACPSPPIAAYSELDPPLAEAPVVNQTISYRCSSSEYTLIGSNSNRCLQDGTWENDPPICQRNCDDTADQIKRYSDLTCYRRLGGNSPRNWSRSLETCNDNEELLATVKDAKTHTFLVELIGNQTENTVWIGAMEGRDWIWRHSGEYIERFFWQNPFPSSNSKDCIELSYQDGSFSWSPRSNQTGNGLLCQYDRSCQSVGLSQSDMVLEYMDICFQFLDVSRNCKDGAEECNERGGFLAEIPDESTNALLLDRALYLRSKGVNTTWWIGGYDENSGRSWYWSDKTRLNYEEWNRGEPSSNVEDCLEMRRDFQYQWNDLICSWPGQTLCQIGIPACGDPGEPSHGNRLPNDRTTYSVGATLHFTCQKGYTLSGESVLRCMNNGAWNHQRPSCEAVECEGSPPNVTLSSNMILGLVYQDIALYTCRDGYIPDNEPISFCRHTGTWITPNFTCTDYRCLGLADALVDFQQNQLTECPSVLQLKVEGNIGQSFFSLNVFQDGILQFLPLELFMPNQELQVPSVITFRITVTTEPVISLEVPARRRRDLFKILYERDYHNVTLDNGGITVEFSPPVFVSQSTPLFINLLTLDNTPLNLPFNDGLQGPLSYLQCPLSPPLNPTDNVSCYDQLDMWAAMEEEFVGLGCAEDASLSFRTYEVCLRIGDAQPVITNEMSVPLLQFFKNYDIPCPIEGAVRRQWLRMSSRGFRTPYESPSPFLRFQPFTAGDMGYYHCEGYGGGAYRDETVATAPVLLAVEGVATIAFSVTFDTDYIDYENSELFPAYAPRFRQAIQAPFFNDDGFRGLISRSLLDDINSYEFPTIVNTHNGSTVVDYVINFNSSMWNDSVNTIVNATASLLEFAYAQPFEGSGDIIGLPIVSGSIVVSSASSCLESVVSGTFGTLNFPATPLDQTAGSQERCSEYSNNTPLPRARRTCRGDLLSAAVWDDPVFIDCFVGEETNEVLDNIARAVVTSENVTEYSYDVAEATANVSDINAEGLRAISDALEKIFNVGNSSTEVTNNTLRIVDNALSAPEEKFVNAVDFEAPTRILDFLEQQITIFQTQGDGNNLTIIGRSAAVVALQLPKASLMEGLGFATLTSPDSEQKSDVLHELNENKTMVYFNPDNIPKTTIDASIVLPPDILELLPPYLLENGTVPVTFLIFQTSKLFLSPDQVYDLGGGRRLTVGTRVISATVEGAVIQGLPQGGEVETAFLELNVTRDSKVVDNRTCVFWDKIDQGGRWSSKGCRREDNPDINRIRCLCDHLTSFAVLLDVSGDVGLYALDVLGMIGCIISIICLLITLVTYLSMKKLRSKQPQLILINLCFALFGLYLVFVIGIDRRYPTAGCVAVGFLIHFFLLSSMSWMLVEAINMYLLFVKVLDATVSHFMLKAALFAYGLPLLVCIVTVAVDSSLYLGDGTYCFVKPGPALYYGVFLIVALLLAANFIIFGLVMQRLSCRKSVAAHKTTQASRAEVWRRVQNAVAISVLLGLTWFFGFLAIGGARLVFNILFLVLNSLQGFFVFLMFCVRQKEVREQWVRWTHCHFAELKPGQRRSDDFVKAKYTKTGSQDGRTSLATSSSQAIQPSSGATVSTTT